MCMKNERFVFNSVYCNIKRISKVVQNIHVRGINGSIRYHFLGSQRLREVFRRLTKTSQLIPYIAEDTMNGNESQVLNIQFYLLEVKSTCSDAGCRNEYLTNSSLLLTPSNGLDKAISFEDKSACGTWVRTQAYVQIIHEEV